jgi:hypothetical protein
MRIAWAWSAVALGLSTAAATARPPQPAKVIARIDLSKPFRLGPGAAFTASQGPDVEDPVYGEGSMAPGRVHLCLHDPNFQRCAPDLDKILASPDHNELFSTVHYLQIAEIVYPKGRNAPPLLHLQVGSFLAGNSDQIRATGLLVYRPRKHQFDMIFRQLVGSNNNQEVRFIASGPLKGSVVTVDSPFGPPFSYVVTVHRLTPDYRYKQVLRYRSATVYGDSNPLAVIDSEMPNILRRLGLWRPGQSFPLPAGHCPHPHLVKTELWCS